MLAPAGVECIFSPVCCLFVPVVKATLNEAIFPLPLMFHKDDTISMVYGYNAIGLLGRSDRAKNRCLAVYP